MENLFKLSNATNVLPYYGDQVQCGLLMSSLTKVSRITFLEYRETIFKLLKIEKRVYMNHMGDIRPSNLKKIARTSFPVYFKLRVSLMSLTELEIFNDYLEEEIQQWGKKNSMIHCEKGDLDGINLYWYSSALLTQEFRRMIELLSNIEFTLKFNQTSNRPF